MADPSQEYATELATRLAIIERDLHAVVRMEMTREEAMDVKRRISLPMGMLNKLFGFQSDRSAKMAVKEMWRNNAY